MYSPFVLYIKSHLFLAAVVVDNDDFFIHIFLFYLKYLYMYIYIF